MWTYLLFPTTGPCKVSSPGVAETTDLTSHMEGSIGSLELVTTEPSGWLEY